MAQTTQNASFGPVFLIAGQPNPLRLFITRIGPKKKVRMNKKQRKKKEDLPMAQTTQDTSFGPVFITAHSFVTS